MKNFACLILGMGLLVNMTMAQGQVPVPNRYVQHIGVGRTERKRDQRDIIENDAIDRVKRGSLNFQVDSESISVTKKSFIEAQIPTLYTKLVEGGNEGKIAKKLSNGLKTEFGGRWMVLIYEHDEIGSFSLGTLPVFEYLYGFYGQTGWYIFRV